MKDKYTRAAEEFRRMTGGPGQGTRFVKASVPEPTTSNGYQTSDAEFLAEMALHAGDSGRVAMDCADLKRLMALIPQRTR